MKRIVSVNLGNLVLSLSDAMDLASPLLSQHQQRTAFIVWELGKIAKLSDERMENNFIAALLHDVGALSLEEKIAIHNSEFEYTDKHCIQGERLLNKVPWLEGTAKIIRFHHKKWQDWNESIETPLVLDSQLLFLGDHIERSINRNQYILHQHEDIISKITSLSGSSLHPQIVDLFSIASNREEFWLDLVSPRLYSLLLNEGPFRKTEIEFSNITLIAELFRNIIDFRSRFTATHSSGVAAAASILSRIFGLTEMETKLLEVAGNLHDIGKLAIPNSILDKPGKLTKEEMAVMKSHTYYTYAVINTIGGIKHIAEWAAYHHERLDGSGYPFHCKADDLSTGARILGVADIFTALAEDRPYRKGMSREGIVQILKQFSEGQLLDKKIINVLFENYDEIFSYVTEKQSVAREFYEKQVAL
ncbi:MAG: HD domain-containing protein [Nitrospirae bacterium]|nr:HD domain-containing protein [Nitrospirota bacterium]